MTKWGKSGRLWIAAVAAILPAIAGCGEKKPGGPAASELGFRHYAGAVQYPAITKDSGGEHGLDALVPYGDCVLGLGTYSNGHRDVGVNWTGDAACTKLSLDPAPETGATPGEVPGDMAPGNGAEGWGGGGLAGRAVLPGEDGSVYAAGTSLSRLDRSGRVHRLADLEVPPVEPDPDAEPGARHPGGAAVMVRSGQRLVLGGSVTEKRRLVPTVWISADQGRTVRRQRLPELPAASDASLTRTGVLAMAAEGRRIVAIGGNAQGQGRPRLPVWASTDGGRTWRAALTPRLHGYAPVSGVLWHDGRWIAYGARSYGGREDYGKPDRPSVLTSADGLHWTVEDTSALGEGRIRGASVDGSGALVLLGLRSGEHIFCGMVWTGGFGEDAERAELGCGDSLPSAITTRADGKVVIAGSNDLWVGGASARRAVSR
ncbi:hypothetical protein [Streptomyces sp. NEAU-YJ-81]|uniref:hypothetical protein n=1 Tax=Streptomyces sp. NEAU-YJ-81 TaxID=2820288 RepID=UPI001ABC8438|nr:hypothetical protein [Streptomyces sp. NEAU-YJ-81]MBO3676856.1 hypothetical protein [Streptomyces sp. NEAU-YJ-81]